jgi:hypothetical protein
VTDLFYGSQLGQYGTWPYEPRTGVSWTATLMSRTPQLSAEPLFDTVADLHYAAISVTDELDGPGQAVVSVPVASLTSGSQSRLRSLDASPCELWLYRNESRVFCGHAVADLTHNRQTVTINASGLAYYLLGMIVDGDYVVSGRDQALIVADLIGAWQSSESGHFGLDLSRLTPTGITRDLTLSTGASVNDAVREMGARDNGFELWVDPATRQVFTLHPRRGRDLSSDVIIDSRQVLEGTTARSVAADQFATDVFAISTGTAGTLVGRAGNAEQRARFGRWGLVRRYYDVTRQATIDAHAAQLSVDFDQQVLSIQPRMLPVSGFGYGEVGAGDVVTIDYDDGLGADTWVRRISRLQVSFDAAGERLAADFV